MSGIRRYASALAVAAVALVAGIIGILTLTVWAPGQHIEAKADPDQPYVMTRARVLPLKAEDVTVTVEAADASTPVSVVVGSTPDVIGWLGDEAYTEVVGLEAGMTQLKVTDHAETDANQAQSSDVADGEQSAAAPQSTADGQAQSEAQTAKEEAQSGASIANPLDNDMWLDQAAGQGSASLTLKAVPDTVSVLATTDGSKAPTLTLTWPVERTNIAAIAVWLLTIVLALIAAVMAVIIWRNQRRRAARADELKSRDQADTTDTAPIDISQMPDAEEASDEADDEGDVSQAEDGTHEADEAESIDVSEPVPVADLTDEADGLPEEQAHREEHDHCEEVKRSEEADQYEEAEEPEELAESAEPVEPAMNGEAEDLVEQKQAAEPAESEEAVEPAELAEPAETAKPAEPVEHSAPTDSGVIDMSLARVPMVFPTRRALREARSRGEESVNIDGHEFNTGLIPIVPSAHQADSGDTLVRQTDGDRAENEADHVSGTGHASRTDRSQDGDDQRGDDTQADAERPHDTGRSQKGAWTSIMSNWLHRDGTGSTKEEQ